MIGQNKNAKAVASRFQTPDALAEGRHKLYLARLERTREEMRRAGVSALLILDPVNILYATGARNMTVFAMRTPARYLLLFAEGPAILFEYFGCDHLAQGLPTIDWIRPATGLCYISSGGDPAGAARRFADEVRGLADEIVGPLDTLAIDRFPVTATTALQARGFRLRDADEVFAPARAIKLAEEMPYLWEAMRRVEVATADMEDHIRAGRTESEIWSEFQRTFIANEGQYVATRLMQSGGRTFPYFQECADRHVQSGDLVCFDTDACGFEGYSVDFSRTFLCGAAPPSDEQRRLYGRAREQLEWNADLFRPGASFSDIAENAWQIPDEHRKSSYYCIGHGLGMSGEFPNIPHRVPGEPYPLEGGVEPGMVLCVESYIGSEQSNQGVKLEQQLLITETGAELMSTFGFDEQLINRML